LVYTSDLHGELLPVPDWTVAGDPKPMLGGIDRLAALVKAERAKGNCLVLDAGDFMRGSPEANSTRGMVMVDALSRIGYDAVCVGERDIEWVTEQIDTIAQKATFRLLGDRALSARSGVDMPVTRPSLLRDVGGIKVGLIGVLDDRLIQCDTADTNLFSSGLKPEQIVEREVKALRSQNADIIVVLAHMSLWRARELAKQFRGVTAFICGHEGKVFEFGALPQESLPRVAEAGARGQRVGICRILLDSATHSVKETRNRVSNLLPDGVRPDSAMTEWVRQRLVPGMIDTVTSCQFELDSMELAQVVAEQVRREVGTEAAILPYSSLDWSLVKGVATRRDICRAVPYDDRLVRVQLDDAGLAEVLNAALAQDDLHRPASAGVSYEVALTDVLHGDLPPRAINVKPEKFTPRHDVQLTRALAVSAGLPTKTYQPVPGTLTEVFVAAVARSSYFPPDVLIIREMQRTRTADHDRPRSSGLVNINTATSEELQTLPGIGPKTAEKIIQYRQANGPFTRIEDVMKVKGIAQGKFAKIKDKITVAR
jgi:comEA protein